MQRHIPVLAEEIYQQLPENAQWSFDGTFWHGGHVEYFLEKELKKGKEELQIIACDIDPKVREKGLQWIEKFKKRIRFFPSSYANINKISKESWVLLDFMLLDIGVNLEHFKDGSRGFSVKTDAPLDMRFDPNNPISAEIWLQKAKPIQIQEALESFGDFSSKSAEAIAKCISEQRKKTPLKTTFQLKELLGKNGFWEKKIVVIFQVIRIMVNKELEQLQIFLKDFPNALKTKGKCAIITYHSIEDRMVKNAFKELSSTGHFELVNKKVIKPHYTEVLKNKAARSAKLRIIQKI